VSAPRGSQWQKPPERNKGLLPASKKELIDMMKFVMEYGYTEIINNTNVELHLEGFFESLGLTEIDASDETENREFSIRGTVGWSA